MNSQLPRDRAAADQARTYTSDANRDKPSDRFPGHSGPRDQCNNRTLSPGPRRKLAADQVAELWQPKTTMNSLSMTSNLSSISAAIDRRTYRPTDRPTQNYCNRAKGLHTRSSPRHHPPRDIGNLQNAGRPKREATARIHFEMAQSHDTMDASPPSPPPKKKRKK